MNKEQAKKLLLCWRPWAKRTDDELAAARLAENDPDLRSLKDRQERFNARVHEELAGIPVPPTLRDQIAARRKTIRVQFWRKPRLLTAVAAVFLVCAIAPFYFQRLPTEDMTFAGFRQRMVGFALREYRMDLFSSDLDEVKAYLARNGRPHQFSLPGGLAGQPVKGGARLAWQGKPVSMVCFEAAGETLYMFVIDEPALDVQLTESPQVSEFKRLSTAAWRSDGKTFFLAAPLPQEQLRALL